MNKPVKPLEAEANKDAAHPGFEILEPRIMLDANLEWGVTGADAGFDTVEAMARLMGSYADEFDRITNELKADVSAELGDAAGLFSLAEDADDMGLGRLTDTLARVDAAVESVVTDFRDEYTAIVDRVLTGSLFVFYNDVEAAVKTWNADIVRADLEAAFDADDLRAIFGTQSLMDGNQATALADLVASMPDDVVSSSDDDPATAQNEADMPATAQNQADMAAAIRTAFADAFLAATSEAERVALMVSELTDVEVGGNKVVTFTQGATAAEVSVEIILPEIETRLDALGHHPGLNMPLPGVFSFGSAAASITFDFEAQNDLAEATPALGLTVDNFAGNLFAFGAPGGMAAGQAVAAGYLSGTLDTVSTAGLQLALDWGGPEFVASVEIGDTNSADDVVTGLGTAGIDFQIQEIGTAGFVDVVDGQSYELVRFDVTSELQFGLGSTSLVSFGTTLNVSADLAALGATQTSAALFNAAATSIVFDTSGVGGAAAFQIQVADMAEAMYNTSADTFSSFLAALGAGTANLLANDQLSVGIPLTDLDVMDGFGAAADLFADLAASFVITPEQLGFIAAGNVTIAAGSAVPTGSYAVEREVTSQTGIVLDEEALARIANLATLELELLTSVASGAGTDTQEATPTSQTRTINFSGIDATDANFLDQIAARFTTALLSVGWTVGAVDGALRFTAVGGPNSTLFKISGNTERDGNDPGDVPFDFASFGFTDRMLRQIDGVDGRGRGGRFQHL